MKEIGGYIELENNMGSLYHDDAIALNNARNCLAFLIEARNIKRIFIPKYLCASVLLTSKAMNVEVEYYPIKRNFRPVLEGIDSEEWIYLVNYYGQLSNDEISNLESKYPKLIVDNVQAYFQMPIADTDTLYSCRKFIGVPDGGFLYTDATINNGLEIDKSYNRMEHILGRYEETASEFYSAFRKSEEKVRAVPLRKMSKLTQNLLRGVDYDRIKSVRERNFQVLERQLGGVNQLDLRVPDGPYMYPVYLEDGNDVRKLLQEKKIYIATLWPDVFDLCAEDEVEYDMARNILPIPIDQRYDTSDMEYVAKNLLEAIDS